MKFNRTEKIIIAIVVLLYIIVVTYLVWAISVMTKLKKS